MPDVRDSFWRGRRFASLVDMRTEALRWSRMSPAHGPVGRWTGLPDHAAPLPV
jgi:hypothetical protein